VVLGELRVDRCVHRILPLVGVIERFGRLNKVLTSPPVARTDKQVQSQRVSDELANLSHRYAIPKRDGVFAGTSRQSQADQLWLPRFAKVNCPVRLRSAPALSLPSGDEHVHL